MEFFLGTRYNWAYTFISQKMGQFRSEFDVPDSKAFHDAFVLMEWVTLGLAPKGFFVDGTHDTRGHSAVFSHITILHLG